MERPSSRSRFALTGMRIVVGLLFVNSGLAKFADHTGTAASFAHWGVPAADAMALAVGVVELVCGVLLVAGVASRWAALPLLTIMAGAVATAGLTDGGGHLVLPPVLALLCALVAIRGGGAWQIAAGPRLGFGRA